MLIRYVIGRPIAPSKPIILKNGKVSKDVRRDTTEALYLKTCAEVGAEPDQDYVEHLQKRDNEAWTYKQDMFCSPELMGSALWDAKQTQEDICRSTGLRPKNGWACQRCRWRSQCEGDPDALQIENWLDAEPAREPTPISVKYGRTTHKITRRRPGFVVSPSELNAWLTCPRLWYIEYSWRLRKAREGKKALPMLRGSLTHEAIRILTSDPDADIRKDIREMVYEMIQNRELDNDSEMVLTDANQITAIADTARNMIGMAMEGVAEVVEHEQRRVMRVRGSKKWLQGIPDAVVRMEDGRLAVIEYKTTSTQKNLSRVCDGYRTNPAVHLYAALVQRGQLAFC